MILSPMATKVHGLGRHYSWSYGRYTDWVGTGEEQAETTMSATVGGFPAF